MGKQQSSALITPLKHKRMMASPYSHCNSTTGTQGNTHWTHTHAHTLFHLVLLWPQVCLSLIPCCVGVMGTLWQLSFCCDLNGLQISSGTMIVRIRCVRMSVSVKVCAFLHACVCVREGGGGRVEGAFDVKIVVKYWKGLPPLWDPPRPNNMPLRICLFSRRLALTAGQNKTHTLIGWCDTGH